MDHLSFKAGEDVSLISTVLASEQKQTLVEKNPHNV